MSETLYSQRLERLKTLTAMLRLTDALVEAFESVGERKAAGAVRWGVMLERQEARMLALQLGTLKGATLAQITALGGRNHA